MCSCTLVCKPSVSSTVLPCSVPLHTKMVVHEVNQLISNSNLIVLAKDISISLPGWSLVAGYFWWSPFLLVVSIPPHTHISLHCNLYSRFRNTEISNYSACRCRRVRKEVLQDKGNAQSRRFYHPRKRICMSGMGILTGKVCRKAILCEKLV